MADRHLLLVQRMGTGRTVASFDAGHSGLVAQLIHRHGIHKKCRFSEHFPKFVCNLDAKRRRMVDSCHISGGMIECQVIDLISAALAGIESHTTAYYGVHGGQIDP